MEHKEKYEKMEVEVIVFDTEDVITTSGEDPTLPIISPITPVGPV